jgi:hypothetical protein
VLQNDHRTVLIDSLRRAFDEKQRSLAPGAPQYDAIGAETSKLATSLDAQQKGAPENRGADSKIRLG